MCLDAWHAGWKGMNYQQYQSTSAPYALGLNEYSGRRYATTLMESIALHLQFQGFSSIVQKLGVAAGQRFLISSFATLLPQSGSTQQLARRGKSTV